jgi:uncharacterized RDD family membrane protein YckC
VATPPLSRPLAARPVQRALFADPNAKVVAFDTYAAAPGKPKAPAKPRAGKTRAVSRRVETQGELEFLPAATNGPRKLGTTVDAVIFCDAPVATRLHRALAASLDWSMVLIGYGLLLLSYHLAGGEFLLNKVGFVVMGAGLLLVAFTYGFFFAFAGGETCGMRWTQVRLLNFDGFPPDRKQRMLRFFASCMSILSCGLGLFWALGDEESLTWPDHMSHTFPTPRGLEDRVFRRR